MVALACASKSESNAAAGTAPKAEASAAAAPKALEQVKPVTVTMQTNLGPIVMELYPDKAPKSVENFLTLAKQGYYDGILFHRIVPGFVIQVGDPLTKDPAAKDRWGTGGPGYKFADEPVQGDYVRGALAMANAGPNTNGSQFFICLQDLTGRLPKKYNYFGRVTAGLEVVDKIAALERDERDCPKSPSKIEKVTIAP
jgi:cyclophilin family peptidyl-prolyl cis-trans isomerase